jgi:protein-S-isoprenylcysteine O-methyltransferase Ste14
MGRLMERLVAREPRIVSYLLVAVQFAALGLIALTGPWLAESIPLLLLEMAGIGLGLWAIAAMRIGNFNVTPDVRRDGQFVARGPYRIIRHPMYLALLLTTLPLIISAPSWWRWLFWLLLLADLVVKIEYEERLLVKHFSEYAVYQQQTKRLVPYLY